MIAAAVIVFREVLEAALVVAVVLGATKGLRGRGSWVGWGVAAGTLGAGVVAALMGRLSESLSGAGQPLFEAAVLLAAVFMLGWHNVWMSRHGARMSRELKELGGEVRAGRRTMAALLVVSAVAVMREGSEAVLFLYGVAAAGAGRASLLAGGLLGLAGGVLAGAALYQGLLRIPVRHFFRVTGWMLLLLAAGMASQAAAFLDQAGLLPPIRSAVWDTSWLLSGQSLLGQALKTLVGYTPAPSALQLLFWAGTLAVIGGLMRLFRERRPGFKAAAAAALVGACLAGGGVPARAAQRAALNAEELNVYSPAVTQGEREVEARGFADESGQQGFAFSGSYSPTPWWESEVYEVLHRDAASPLLGEALVVEQRFQLAPAGAWPVDMGLLAEVSVPLRDGDPYEEELTPIIEKQAGRLLVTLNPTLEWQSGPGYTPGTGLHYGARAEYRLSPLLAPAVEAFGEPGVIGSWPRTSLQNQQAGPALYGTWSPAARRRLNYSAALLFGLDAAAPVRSVV
ncbi:MAG: FTR1 family protein, partial [Elusimicrobia bacterium]|nr:FTR1 family protein [Elusimicrobiota bacterium]